MFSKKNISGMFEKFKGAVMPTGSAERFSSVQGKIKQQGDDLDRIISQVTPHMDKLRVYYNSDQQENTVDIDNTRDLFADSGLKSCKEVVQLFSDLAPLVNECSNLTAVQAMEVQDHYDFMTAFMEDVDYASWKLKDFTEAEDELFGYIQEVRGLRDDLINLLCDKVKPPEWDAFVNYRDKTNRGRRMGNKLPDSQGAEDYYKTYVKEPSSGNNQTLEGDDRVLG